MGTGYFDEVAQVISGGLSSTLALKGSTEEAQFERELKGVLRSPRPRSSSPITPAASATRARFVGSFSQPDAPDGCGNGIATASSSS